MSPSVMLVSWDVMYAFLSLLPLPRLYTLLL